jgi:hypothetical protein
MQGRSEDQRELLDAESVAGHLLKPGSVFAFLAEHRQRLFPDELFADLFPSGRGRPSVPADVMASVIVLQTLHGMSDSGTTDAVTFDLRWKAAIGWPVTAKAFHDTTLTYWRRRLAASAEPNRIFRVVQQVIAESGALKGRTRRALDSTVLDDAVATQDTVTQLIAAIRRVRREVAGADQAVAEVTSAHDYDDPGKPRIVWNDADARNALVDALVRDALAVLDALGEQEPGSKAADAVGLLALVAGQDVELVDPDDPGDPPQWRIARRVAPDRVISTVDPDARHAHKTVHRRQDGFKAHLAVEPDTGLITECRLTKASGAGSHDAEAGIDLLTNENTPVEVLADSAYATGEALATFETGTRRWSSPGQSRPPFPAVSPSKTSVSTWTPGRRPARPGRAFRSVPAAPPASAAAAPDARWSHAAPLPSGAAPSRSASTSRCSASIGDAPRTQAGSRPTGSTGRWSNAPSPGSCAMATAKSATAASRRTTPGSTTAPPASTCAACSRSAWSTATKPGPWPKDPGVPDAPIDVKQLGVGSAVA